MPNWTAVHAICMVALVAMPSQVLPGTEDSGLCRSAAEEAASETGVPYDVLLAVSLTETGRNGQPWPWAVSIGGQGYWPATAEEAASLVQEALDAGLTNIDLGCFQLNLYWHAGAFRSIEDMIDPQRNAAYAAGFLAEKYSETGDWSLAAAAYHSGTPEHAEVYQARFEMTWAALGQPNADTGALPKPSENRFPLLVAGQAGSYGSLVPVTVGNSRLIAGP